MPPATNLTGLVSQGRDPDDDAFDVRKTGLVKDLDQVRSVQPQAGCPGCRRRNQDGTVGADGRELETTGQLPVQAAGQAVFDLHQQAGALEQVAQRGTVIRHDVGDAPSVCTGLRTTGHMMKRTPATMRMASIRSLRALLRRPSTTVALWATTLLLTASLTFWLGRSTAPAPGGLLAEVEALRLEIQLQQRQVDRLGSNHSMSVNALAARLAELQAASTRLDALGERLAQMGQLSPDEFDFSEPAPVGGPADFDSVGPASEPELRLAIGELGARLRRQSGQLDALRFLMVNRQLESELTPAGWPVRKGWISSRFGERNDPFTGERTQHRGLDFAGTPGTEVLSVASGVVIWAANRSDYGHTVEIDHGNGYRTRYAHNQELVVQAGDRVSAGQVIARMGSTGRASAPHVHFEVLKDGQRINPARFVDTLR